MTLTEWLALGLIQEAWPDYRDGWFISISVEGTNIKGKWGLHPYPTPEVLFLGRFSTAEQAEAVALTLRMSK